MISYSCKFGIHNCTVDNFELFVHPLYLNCYTFKGIKLDDKGTKAKVRNTGPQNGLSLILKAQDTSINPYFDSISHTVNTKTLRIAIHEPGTPSGISESGIDMLPGKSTSLGLMQKLYQRLEWPYADCKHKTQYKFGDVTYKVNTEFCNEICVVQDIRERCGCVSINQNIIFGNLISKTIKSCLYMNEINPEQGVHNNHCEIDMLRNRFNSPSKKCECNWNCKEVDYDISMSQAQWPVRSAVYDFLNHYVKSGFAKETLDQLKAYYSNKTLIEILPSSLFQKCILGGVMN